MKADSIFVDTNLFLRYLTNDVPVQADAMEKLLRQAEQGKITLVTNGIVIAEIVWTLESYYELERSEIQNKVLAILNTPGLEIPESNLILKSIMWYSDKNVDFIDAYNAAWMEQEGIEKIYTFDQKHFSRFDEVEVLKP
ncbi:MAG: nucleotide-binding protein [Anaerolineales bacterium]|nr:type II toxin-antitoxin system VapC family toxin [Anaerolineae bacterium]PWB76887.1 MAG: nucleotide-binding protein [Anaerolineales bacterium]